MANTKLDRLLVRKCITPGCYNYRHPGYSLCIACLQSKAVRMPDEDVEYIKKHGK
ncbi:MAG: hypothetical protein WC364_05760 [Eubacteriales bacterium]|jgi:hypothetical protein